MQPDNPPFACAAGETPAPAGSGPIHSGLAGILENFRLLKQSESDFVLATIVETQGSTYRKAGARMLLTRTGLYYGLLGGGCFEADLAEHAKKVFDTRQPRELFYDMRSPEDLVWGLGLGCNGAVRIWLEYVTAENNFAPLSVLETALGTESASVFITVLQPGGDSPTIHYLFGDTDKIPIELAAPDEFTNRASQVLETGRTALETTTTPRGEITAFYSTIVPPTHLLVIGGGPDALPVTALARQLGWQVTVVDYRENYSKADNFPAAHRVVCATPEQLSDRVNLAAMDAVVLMSHKYEYDLRYLQQLTYPTLQYIGLLGPTARRNELLREAGPGVRQRLGHRVYGPVGLDIGGELPEEIALSLLAEIQMVLNHRKGGHLAHLGPQEFSAVHEGLGCIVLAAGGSTRFGALKQLLEYNGRSLLNRVVRVACEIADDRVIVVHGPKPTKCQRDIASYPVKNLVNEDWERGMSSSITTAMGAVPSNYDDVLILLCDQPLIEKEQIERLLQAQTLNPDRIIASAYADTIGVPAIFPKKYFYKLQLLSGDQGARKLFSSLGDEVISVPVPEAEFDIDTQEDFARLLFNHKP